MLRSGIYQIVNVETGERYIGSTKKFAHRKATHLHSLRSKQRSCPKLQDAFNKHGEKSFKFLILEYVQTNKERLIEREQFWINTLHPEYNDNLIAGSAIPRSARTPKAIKLISQSIEQLWDDPEYRAKHCKPRNWKNGIPNRTGVKLSDETKEKIRQANLGKNNPHYGKPRSQGFLDKVRKIYPGVVSPDGEIYSYVIGLNKFCREHNLDSGQMSRLMSGKVQTYKGWK